MVNTSAGSAITTEATHHITTSQHTHASAPRHHLRCFARMTLSYDSAIGFRYASTVRWALRYGGGSSGWMVSSALFCSCGGRWDVIRMGARVGDGADRSVKLVRAAIEELEDIVESVRFLSWFDRPESFSTVGWTGMVAVDVTEDVEVRRSCRWACDDEGEDRLGEADAVRMLVGELARRLVGEDDAVVSCPEAESGSTVAKGARGAGFPANAPWP